ncbi:hypothetical protein IAT38_004602 [Cryptococcus sp. DSM 104549]
MMESIGVHDIATPPSRKPQPYIDLTADTPSPAPVRQQSAAARPQPHGPSGLSKKPAMSRGNTYANAASTSGPGYYYSHDPLSPMTVVDSDNRPRPAHSGMEGSFGSSLPSKGKPQQKPITSVGSYGNYIKPATPNAFKGPSQGQVPPKQTFSRPSQPAFGGTTVHAPGAYINGWPSWVQDGRPNPGVVPSARAPLPVKPKPAAEEDDVPREDFNVDAVPVTAEDYQRYNGDADKHMQELLSGAIGDGEDEMGDDGVQEGEDRVEGFADKMRLMPHQVRGVKWMRQRETGRKYGGILADDMGLGKTVQTLARIVEGKATAAEKRAGYKAGTLIVAPLAVMEQWASECKTKTKPGVLKVTTHHGPSRTKTCKTLESYDVVITTFQTLSSEFGAYELKRQKRLDEGDSDEDDALETGRKKGGKKQKAAATALFDVKWLRIVVDEAQNIKNRNTKMAKAAVALRAKYRWCLTGTPIQNNVEELFSLFQFLRARPLDDWHVFRERISSLVKDNRTKLAMKRLHVVLKAIMLRRTKDAKIDGKAILNLPGRTVKVMACDFDVEERAFYDALEKQTEITFNKFVKSGGKFNQMSMLTLLLRLRQACVHPTLVTKSISTDADAIGATASAGASRVSSSQNLVEAPKDDADDLADLLGGLGVAKGKTCQMCFIKLQDPAADHCPACAELAARQARRQSTASDNGLPPTSAKIRMLLKLLSEVEERSGKTEKTIVFSQFTSFLDLVEPFLKHHKMRYVRFDGSMRADKREVALDAIKNDPAVRVILISFKAGSTGLNLTCCNNVILMDLWWNPALEDQAFDRAHRLGQKLDVNIFKLTIEETVEDRILALQNMKRELANAALSGQTGQGLMKLTMDDIMQLFKRSSKHDVSDDEDSDDD